MLDATEYGESDYVNNDIVKNSPTKKFVVIEAAEEDDNFNEGKQKLKLVIEIDKKKKAYNPNKDSIKNLISTWGKDAEKWVGKVGKLKVLSVNGKERVFAESAE